MTRDHKYPIKLWIATSLSASLILCSAGLPALAQQIVTSRQIAPAMQAAGVIGAAIPPLSLPMGGLSSNLNLKTEPGLGSMRNLVPQQLLSVTRKAFSSKDIKKESPQIQKVKKAREKLEETQPAVLGGHTVLPQLRNIQVLSSEPHRKFFVFTLDFHSSLFEPARVFGENHQKYIQWIKSQLDPNPVFVIERQKKIFVEHGMDAHNFDAVLTSKVGNIFELSVLDTLLFNFHFMQYDFTKPIEFQAIVLKKENQLKIYYFSTGQGLAVGVSPLDEDQIVEEDLKDDWQLIVDMHNHPFFFKNTLFEDVVGAPMPSDGDVRAYRHWLGRIRYPYQIRISNGINTFSMSSQETRNLSDDITKPYVPPPHVNNPFRQARRKRVGHSFDFEKLKEQLNKVTRSLYLFE